MDRIVYTATSPGGTEVASFDRAKAAGVSGTAFPQAVDTDAVARRGKHKLDGLDRLCLDNLGIDADIIVYCVVSKGGGIDGMDRSDKGGRIKSASFDKAEAEKACDAWSHVQARVVSPNAIAFAALGRLDAVERLCLYGEKGRPEPRRPEAPHGLVGRAFSYGDRTGKVVEPTRNLPSEKVTVRWSNETITRNEDLRLVLACLSRDDASLRPLSDLVERACALSAAATSLASAALAEGRHGEREDALLSLLREVEDALSTAREQREAIVMGVEPEAAGPRP